MSSTFYEQLFCRNFFGKKSQRHTVIREKLCNALSYKNVAGKCDEIDTWSQFHQHFTGVFFVWKCFFHQNVTREKHFHTKNASVNVMKLTPELWHSGDEHNILIWKYCSNFVRDFRTSELRSERLIRDDLAWHGFSFLRNFHRNIFYWFRYLWPILEYV